MTLQTAAQFSGIATAGLIAITVFLMAGTLRLQQRSYDANTLFKFLSDISEAETRLQTDDSELRQMELTRYLNLLEALAASINHKLIGKTTRVFARDRLLNDLRLLEEHGFWDPRRPEFESNVATR